MNEKDKSKSKIVAADKKRGDEREDKDTNIYPGAFTNILKKYEGTKTMLKVGSFTHREIECYVIRSDARVVEVKKVFDGKTLFLSQASINNVEEA